MNFGDKPNQFYLASFPKSGNTWIRILFSNLLLERSEAAFLGDLAIETLALLKPSFPDLRLTMLGPDKGLRSKSEELVKLLNLEDAVIFVGPVPNKDLIQYYQSHAVFLNTTSYESFGTAVVEAAATAMPIVSSKVGELPYIWKHKENILFADQLDAESFAKQVRVILKNDGLAQELGVAAAKRVPEFEWSRINAQWIALLRELTSLRNDQ